MRRLPTVSRHVRVALLVAAFAGLSAATVPSCEARSVVSRIQTGHVRHVGRHESGSSLVRCSSLRQPARPLAGYGRSSSRRQDPVRGRARLFAPTNQAMFFSHAGDRCLWRPRIAARG